MISGWGRGEAGVQFIHCSFIPTLNESHETNFTHSFNSFVSIYFSILRVIYDAIIYKKNSYLHNSIHSQRPKQEAMFQYKMRLFRNLRINHQNGKSKLYVLRCIQQQLQTLKSISFSKNFRFIFSLSHSWSLLFLSPAAAATVHSAI